FINKPAETTGRYIDEIPDEIACHAHEINFANLTPKNVFNRFININWKTEGTREIVPCAQGDKGQNNVTACGRDSIYHFVKCAVAASRNDLVESGFDRLTRQLFYLARFFADVYPRGMQRVASLAYGM